MLLVDPFIMLGKTVPEERKDGRISVCSAGYVPELGLVRVYPLARQMTPPRWSRTRVALERNPQDPRRESFRLAADRSKEAHARINAVAFQHVGEVSRSARTSLLETGDRRHKFFVGGLGEANERRMSLAIVRPRQQRLVWTHPGDRRELQLAQLELDVWREFAAEHGIATPGKVPRIAFTDGTGDHLLQFRDWGAFEFVRKYGEESCDRMRFDTGSALLVGNILRHQNSWLVISSLALSDQMALEIPA